MANYTTYIIPILEGLSYIFTIILTIIAGFGLNQIFIAKKDIIIRSKRESVNCASEKIDFFRKEIIPNISEIFDAFKTSDNKIDLIRFKMQDFSLEELKTKKTNIATHFNKILEFLKIPSNDDTWVKIQNTANMIESFSIPFSYGIAEENIAFQTIAKIYCEYIEKTFFYYCSTRNNASVSGNFENTIKIYKMWSARLEKRQLEKNLANINCKIDNIKDCEIKTIGSEI